MRKRFYAASLIGFLLAATPGCAAVLAALPTVIAAVTDAMMILDQIEVWVNAYFAAHPDKEKQERVVQALGKTRNALVAANRTCSGAEKLDQAKVDDAFADFKVAYAELVALCGGLPGGGFKVAKKGEPLLAATPGGLTVPEPQALTLKVER